MPVPKLPRLGHKDVDLHTLYKEVIGRGGVMEVINKKCWKEVASVFNFPATCTNAGYTLRINYMKLLYPYELKYFHGLSDNEVQKRLQQSGLPNQQMSASALVASKDSLVNKPISTIAGTPSSPFSTPLGSPGSIQTEASLDGNANKFPTRPVQPISSPIIIPVRDYTLLTKRSVSPGVQESDCVLALGFVPAKRQCVADPELQQQRKLVALLESGDDVQIDRSLQALILLSYGTEIEIRVNGRLLDALMRIIQRARVCPQPMQVIFVAGSERVSVLPFYESADAVDEDEESTQRVYDTLFSVCKSENRIKLHRQKQVIKIIQNFSFISNNKAILAQHIPLTSVLIEFLQQGKYVASVIEILGNIAKHLQISPHCKCLSTIIDLMFSDDWEIVLLAIEFFKKNTQRSGLHGNEIVYSTIEDRFYTRLVELLCLPQALEKQFLSFDIDMETARAVQSAALSVIHNLALYRGAPSSRACQRNNCLEILMSMVDLPDVPDISRKVALTLINFVDEPSNVPFIEVSLEKIILLVIREGPGSRLLLKLLTKLSPKQERNVPQLIPNFK